MKKAYVKPVFLAEEFEGTASVAACDRGSSKTFEVWDGVKVCNSNGHEIGQGSGKSSFEQSYISYATDNHYRNGKDAFQPINGTTGSYSLTNMDENIGSYVFTSWNFDCDFAWDSKGGNVGVWVNTKDNNSLITNNVNRKTLYNNDSAGILWLAQSFMNFFRKNESGCEPVLDGGSPFSG